MEKRNIFECLPVEQGFERFDTLLETGALKLERIVSHAHTTPLGEWFEQDCPEWVVLLRGAAGLCIEGRDDILVLRAGDYVYLPARLRHRVEWTDASGETVWLALHHCG